MSKKVELDGTKPKKKRKLDPLKYPRAVAAAAGLHLVEDLFPGLTPKDFREAAPPRDAEDET